MSHKVVTLVYSKRVGSAHRKAILAYMADRASDDGRGVFCSKGTIADEAEIARSTVFKTIRELVNEGVLIEAGTRPCRNGATVVYDLNLDAIRAFPDVKPEVDRSAQRTPTSPPAGPVRSVTSPPAGPYQSASRTPTGPLNGPKPSLEPSLNMVVVTPAREAENPVAHPTDRERLLAAMGVKPDGIAGPSRFLGTQGDMAEAARWLALPGITIDVACAEIARITAGKRDGPPKSFRYFTDAIQRLSGQLTAPQIQPIAPPQTAGANRAAESRAFDASIHALADRLAAGTANLYDPDRDPFARVRGRSEDFDAGAYLPGPVLRPRH